MLLLGHMNNSRGTEDIVCACLARADMASLPFQVSGRSQTLPSALGYCKSWGLDLGKFVSVGFGVGGFDRGEIGGLGCRAVVGGTRWTKLSRS